jgi:hypothetical protein
MTALTIGVDFCESCVPRRCRAICVHRQQWAGIRKYDAQHQRFFLHRGFSLSSTDFFYDCVAAPVTLDRSIHRVFVLPRTRLRHPYRMQNEASWLQVEYFVESKTLMEESL